jgi:hypothetical protein
VNKLLDVSSLPNSVHNLLYGTTAKYGSIATSGKAKGEIQQMPGTSSSNNSAPKGQVSGKVGKASIEPLLNRVFQWLREHPNVKGRGKLRKLAFDLGLDYQQNKKYLWKLSSQWQTDLRNERGSKTAVRSKPDEQHAVFAQAKAPACLNRKKDAEVTAKAVSVGWRLSKNRNRILFWAEPGLGRVQWWETGTIFVHVAKPIQMARVKTLLYHAFNNTGLIFDWTIMEQFVNSADWYSSHDTYDTPNNKPLPYMKITTYEVLGVKAIKTGDFSHKNKLEVEVAKPKIVENYEELVGLLKANADVSNEVLSKNSKIIEQFNEYLAAVSSPKSTVSSVDRNMIA